MLSRRMKASEAPRTTEASPARAVVSAGHVSAAASIHTGVGVALVIVNVAICAAPARVTNTVVAVGKYKTNRKNKMSVT